MVASEEEKTSTGGHGMWARTLGWCTIGLLIAFLINNILVVGFGFKEVETLTTSVNVQNFSQLMIYLVFITWDLEPLHHHCSIQS